VEIVSSLISQRDHLRDTILYCLVIQSTYLFMFLNLYLELINSRLGRLGSLSSEFQIETLSRHFLSCTNAASKRHDVLARIISVPIPAPIHLFLMKNAKIETFLQKHVYDRTTNRSLGNCIAVIKLHVPSQERKVQKRTVNCFDTSSFIKALLGGNLISSIDQAMIIGVFLEFIRAIEPVIEKHCIFTNSSNVIYHFVESEFQVSHQRRRTHTFIQDKHTIYEFCTDENSPSLQSKEDSDNSTPNNKEDDVVKVKSRTRSKSFSPGVGNKSSTASSSFINEYDLGVIDE
jgi:hypothetical protein